MPGDCLAVSSQMTVVLRDPGLDSWSPHGTTSGTFASQVEPHGRTPVLLEGQLFRFAPSRENNHCRQTTERQLRRIQNDASETLECLACIDSHYLRQVWSSCLHRVSVGPPDLVSCSICAQGARTLSWWRLDRYYSLWYHFRLRGPHHDTLGWYSLTGRST